MLMFVAFGFVFMTGIIIGWSLAAIRSPATPAEPPEPVKQPKYTVLDRCMVSPDGRHAGFSSGHFAERACESMNNGSDALYMWDNAAACRRH